MGPWQILGSLIAFVGMVVIVVKGSLAGLLSFDFSSGEMLALVSAILFPVYSVLLKRAKFELPRLPLLVLLLGAGAVVALPFFFGSCGDGEHANLNLKGLLALAYVAIPGGAILYLFFNWAVEVLGASRTGATMYLQPIFIAALGLAAPRREDRALPHRWSRDHPRRRGVGAGAPAEARGGAGRMKRPKTYGVVTNS